MTTKRVKTCNTPECRRLRQLLSDFIDHTLHWRTARSLEAHLSACPPCRCYVATIETTIVLYRKRPVVDVPVAVHVHLRDLLRERHEHEPRQPAGCRPGAAGPRASAGTKAAGKAGRAR